MAWALFSPPQDFLAVYFFNNYRTDYVLRVAATISFCGAMFRFLAISQGEFWPIVTGQVISACVGSIFLNSQIIISNRWFSDKERAIAMAVLNVAAPTGQIISFALTGIMFADVSSVEHTMTDEEFREATIADTESLLWY